jgi:membrane-associated HD superfamily phosphohydrolase
MSGEENKFLDTINGKEDWYNAIENRTHTEAASEIYKKIWDKTNKDFINANDFMAKYYGDKEKELKSELKDEDRYNGDKEHGFKKQIENGNIEGSTLEIFVARYSYQIFCGQDKSAAIRSILKSLSNFTKSFEKAVEKEYEMNLEDEAEKELTEEDFSELLNDASSQNGDKTNSITIDNVVDYAKDQANQKVTIDELNKLVLESYEEEIEDDEQEYISKEILKKEIRQISKDFKNNIMDHFVEEFIRQNVTEDMIEEFNKADGIIDRITDYGTWIKRTVINMQDKFTDEAVNSTAQLGGKTPYILLLMCGLSIGLIFGVPITPSVVSGAAASTAVITK